MDSEEKSAFGDLLEAILARKTPYYDIASKTLSDDGTKLTVLAVQVIANDYRLRDHPSSWKVTTQQADVIRAYFANVSPSDHVAELYREFPGTFEGEYREILKGYFKAPSNPKELGIPLF